MSVLFEISMGDGALGCSVFLLHGMTIADWCKQAVSHTSYPIVEFSWEKKYVLQCA